MKIYDISKTLDSDTAIYPGNPEFNIQKVEILKKDGYNLSKISMGTHFGTHVDAPLHFIEGGEDVSSISLYKLIGECEVLDFQSVRECIKREDIEKFRIETKILVLKTKNSNTPENIFDENFIYLSHDFIEYIVKIGIHLICTDGPSVKQKGAKDFQHKLLFKNGINIIEGVDLKNIKEGKYFFIALPLKIKGADGSPIRVILIEDYKK